MHNSHTTPAEARRIIGVIRTAIFDNGLSFCAITSQEYASLRNALPEDIPEIGFTPGRHGVVALAFGGEVHAP